MSDRSLRTRLAAFLHRASLDRQLAEGRNPRTSPELALRARQLTQPPARRRLAEALRSTLDAAARSGEERHSPGVPLNRSAVLACRPQLEDLADRLAALEHPRPRGVAIARWLLVDGAGPLYVRARAQRLANVVDAANRALGSGHSLV